MNLCYISSCALVFLFVHRNTKNVYNHTTTDEQKMKDNTQIPSHTTSVGSTVPDDKEEFGMNFYGKYEPSIAQTRKDHNTPHYTTRSLYYPSTKKRVVTSNKQDMEDSFYKQEEDKKYAIKSLVSQRDLTKNKRENIKHKIQELLKELDSTDKELDKINDLLANK
jgi:hypothetical protein